MKAGLLCIFSVVLPHLVHGVQFVDISTINPRIQLDIRYATSHNFLNIPVYTSARCFLHFKVAEALDVVQTELEKKGLGLKVFDGYRPLFVQQQMWDLIQDERYVSNPAKNKGRHTRGTAIDLTLVDHRGEELDMPTPFDDFTERAFSDAQDVTEAQAKNRRLLKEEMEKQGFVQYPYEWWHFDFAGWNDDTNYPPCNLTFEELSQ